MKSRDFSGPPNWRQDSAFPARLEDRHTIVARASQSAGIVVTGTPALAFASEAALRNTRLFHCRMTAAPLYCPHSRFCLPGPFPRTRRIRIQNRTSGCAASKRLRAFQEDQNGYRHCQVLQLSKRLRLHSAGRRRPRCLRFHVSAVERAGMRGLVEGQKLTFDIEADRRSGKPAAANLQNA